MKSNLDNKKLNTILSQISHGPLNSMNSARRIPKVYQDKSKCLYKCLNDNNNGSMIDRRHFDVKEIYQNHSSCDKFNSLTSISNHLINENMKNLGCSKETTYTNNMASEEISIKESSEEIYSRKQLMILVKKLQNKNKGIVQFKDIIVLRFRLILSKLKKIMYTNISQQYSKKANKDLNINNLLIEYVKSIPNSKGIKTKNKNQTVLIPETNLIINRYETKKNQINTNTNSPDSDLRNDISEETSKGELIKIQEGQLNKFFNKQKCKNRDKSTKENKLNTKNLKRLDTNLKKELNQQNHYLIFDNQKRSNHDVTSYQEKINPNFNIIDQNKYNSQKIDEDLPLKLKTKEANDIQKDNILNNEIFLSKITEENSRSKINMEVNTKDDVKNNDEDYSLVIYSKDSYASPIKKVTEEFKVFQENISACNAENQNRILYEKDAKRPSKIELVKSKRNRNKTCIFEICDDVIQFNNTANPEQKIIVRDEGLINNQKIKHSNIKKTMAKRNQITSKLKRDNDVQSCKNIEKNIISFPSKNYNKLGKIINGTNKKDKSSKNVINQTRR